MSATLEGWTPELERSFKEVLFRFLEEVQSTKAALYLMTPDGAYLLVTQYGFRGRDLLATSHVPADPLVARLRGESGQPLVVNDPQAFPEITPYLQGAGTSRLMAVPIVAGDRLIGFVDARDKGRKRAFEAGDRGNARTIAGALLDLITRSHLYGPEVVPAPAPVTSPAPVASPAPAPSETPGPRVMPAAPVAEGARGETEDGAAAVLDRAGLARVIEEGAAVAHRHGVALVALTVVEAEAAVTVLMVGERSGVVDEAAIIRHQSESLREAGWSVPQADEWRLEARRYPACGDPTPNRIIASAVLLAADGWSLVASVVAAMGRAAAADGLRRIQVLAEERAELVRLRFARRLLARRLLEPGSREYAELRSHSLAVSQLSWTLARRLGFDEVAAEEAALAGLLHDVGMRDLRYDELYRASSPSADERLEYRRHVDLGEQILRGTGLDQVAQAVRHHHERWDGKGYPDRLAGADIPLLSRVVHVAEVYDVLTSPTSYRRPVPAEKAMAILKTAAGHQFDPKIVELLGRSTE